MHRTPDDLPTLRAARRVLAAVVVALAVGCQATRPPAPAPAPVVRPQAPDPFPALVLPFVEYEEPAEVLPSVFDPPVDVPPIPPPPPVPPAPLPPLTLPPLTVREPSPPVVVPPPAPVPVVHRHEPSPVAPPPVGCATCGKTGCNQCEPLPQTGFAARLVGLMYESLCCPDPCYQPKWMPLADAAFFTDSARPVGHMRLRWEYGHEARLMDRAEYFWARSDGNGKGLRPSGAAGIPRADYHELSQYTETAAGPGFSAFVSTPYRSVNPTFSDPPSAAGFGDISLGTKSVLFDSELFLLTLQFKTTLPVGQPGKGLGTGHLSLEPSLLFGLRVSPNSYLQGQIAEWIPIGGDPTYSGALLHYHLAYNHTLWQPIQAIQLVGTFEAHGWSFQDGGWTHPDGTFRQASGTTVVQVGPGVRLFFCDKYDFGVGTSFGVSGLNQVQDTYRFEMRVRF